MAPKVNCNPLKLTNIVTYLQKSRVAHNIKDLEKALPSVASINGMQVKDYLQSLSDDSKINVEKIGSGNWYWSFASQDKATRAHALSEAQSTYTKSSSTVTELRSKLAEAQALREDDGAAERGDLEAARTELEAEMRVLRRELAAYSESDPTEVERKRGEVGVLRREAEQVTDEIYAMEGWFGNVVGDGEQMRGMKEGFYGAEFDEEEVGLRELV